jgi:hypothetical protein
MFLDENFPGRRIAKLLHDLYWRNNNGINDFAGLTDDFLMYDPGDIFGVGDVIQLIELMDMLLVAEP